MAASVARAIPSATFSNLAHLLPALLSAAWLLGVRDCSSRVVRALAADVRSGAGSSPLREGREVEALRRLERVTGIRNQIGMLLSRASFEPGIFGIARPVLAWPEGTSERLADAHLEAILAHELWHVRRRDNLAAAVHIGGWKPSSGSTRSFGGWGRAWRTNANGLATKRSWA